MMNIKIFVVLVSFILIMSNDVTAKENNTGNGSAHQNEILAMASESESYASKQDNIYNSRQNAITRAVEKCSPAIVGINVTEVHRVAYNNYYSSHPLLNYFYNRGRAPRYKEYEVSGLGSGFIISEDGYIVTNHHVAGNASRIVVTMTDGSKHEAKIIGSDMVSDVALLKIKGSDFPYIKMDDSDKTLIGEWVIAFGNPFGLFNINAKPTVTVGVVSNKGVNFLHEGEEQTRVYKNMLQTDAAISSGNSGGPLINGNGHVIGMNTVIFSTSQNQKGAGSIGIGFSIPINRVKEMVDKLMNKGSIQRNAYLGMDVRQIDERLARLLRLNKEKGLVIVSVNNHSPAYKSGIEPGDVILEINGEKMHRFDDYLMSVVDSEVGDKLKFSILRNGEVESKIMKIIPKRRHRRGR